MILGTQEKIGSTSAGVESVTDIKRALERLNTLAAIAVAFAFDLGGGRTAFGDHGFLSGKVFRKFVDARIRADVLLRGIYLTQPQRFTQDGYLASDIAFAEAEILRTMRAALKEHMAPHRKKAAVPETTLARVRAVLGE